LRHARVRQWVRQTKSLPLAQKQAGWSRLQMAYLTIGDGEARELMSGVTECCHRVVGKGGTSGRQRDRPPERSTQRPGCKIASGR
jgi:hypothetical protein